jgi:hypothetical protein
VGTLPAISGVNLTNLNASNLASGTVAVARLGSGASASKFLRGDSTWQTPITIDGPYTGTIPAGAGSPLVDITVASTVSAIRYYPMRARLVSMAVARSDIKVLNSH